jgi:hypothetical protein
MLSVEKMWVDGLRCCGDPITQGRIGNYRRDLMFDEFPPKITSKLDRKNYDAFYCRDRKKKRNCSQNV